MDIKTLMKVFGEKVKRVRLDVCPTGNGKIRLTLFAEPGSGSERNAFVPLQADGTPEEVDADLDKILSEYFGKCAPRQTNLDQIDKHIKEIEKKAEEDRKAKLEKRGASSPQSPATPKQSNLAEKYGAEGKKQEVATTEPDLFGNPAPQSPKAVPDEATSSGIKVDPESAQEYDDNDGDENAA